MKSTRFEIVRHGWDNAQYFPGCGTSFTEFDECVTGIGDNAVEAYRDAVEQIYSGWDGIDGFKADSLKLPHRPRGINAKDRVPASVSNQEDNECWFYVSIRFKKGPK